MFHFKLCVFVFSSLLLAILTANINIKKHRLFGFPLTSTCLDHTIQDIHMHSCSAGNSVELSQYLNGLSTNLQVRTALRNQLKTVQTLKLNQRRHHGRTMRGVQRCQTNSNTLRADCRAAISKMSPTCSKLMCTVTEIYLNKFEDLEELMTWEEIATVLETIWSKVGNSCPKKHSTGEDCVTEVYSTARTCYSDATQYTPAETGLTYKERSDIISTIPLIEEIHNAFCEESVCLNKLVQIMKNTHDIFKDNPNCKLTEQMGWRRCKMAKKNHLNNLSLSGAADYSTCAKSLLTKINRMAKEMKSSGKYAAIYQHGSFNPLYKIKLHYSIICELLLHYHYKGKVGYVLTDKSYSSIVEQCRTPADTTEINPQNSAQALHTVQVSHQNTNLEYNDSDQRS